MTSPSPNRVEFHPAGFAVFAPTGECVATLTLTSGVGDATLLILAKDAPALEIALSREEVRRLEDIVHRVSLEALFAANTTGLNSDAPRVPRHPVAPHLPS